MNNQVKLLTLFTALIGLLLLFSCNDDCPVCPDPEPKVISDYDFYLRDVQSSSIRVYNTKLDSFTDFYETGAITDYAISQNKDRLFISTYSPFTPDSILVLNLPDMDTTAVIQEYGAMEISNNDKYIVIRNSRTGLILFYDANSYSLLFADTGYSRCGHFLGDDSKYYTIYPPNNEIRIYDMIGESLYTTIQIIDSLFASPYNDYIVHHRDVLPIGNGERLYVILEYGSGIFETFLISYNVTNDSTGIRYVLGEGNPIMDLTPDGKTLIVTDPPSTFGYYGHSSDVIFWNVDRDRVSHILSTEYSLEGNNPYGMKPGPFAITPDSRYMLIVGGYESAHEGSFAMIDLFKKEFINFYIPDLDSNSFTDVKCPNNQL